MQQIVSQLIFNGAEDVPVAEISPWVDLRLPPKDVKLPALEAQTHRRFLKTHLPVDALRFSPRAKYLYIGRDGRDVIWSMYNHHANANESWYRALNDTPGRVGPPIEKPPADVVQYYRDWLDRDGHPFWPFFDNVRSWWEVRHLPNVHAAPFRRSEARSRRRYRTHRRIPRHRDRRVALPDIVEHCGFDYMKRNATAAVPLGGAFWDGGAETFIHKGTNGRWRDLLTAQDCVQYESRARRELGDECTEWLKGGALTDE